MKIIPAIDLKNGESVRLFQGDFEQSVVYSSNPVNTAESFELQGAQWLHLVDLDGAKQGALIQYDLIEAIRSATSMKIQVGGGIRMSYQIKRLFDMGVDRVLIGSIAILQPKIVSQWIEEYGEEKVVLALDVKTDTGIPLLATSGWTQLTGQPLWDLMVEYENIRNILTTDISRDGTLTSPNFDLYSQCMARYPNINWIASGGVSSLNDIKKLKKIGINELVVGKAIYENRFTINEAMSC